MLLSIWQSLYVRTFVVILTIALAFSVVLFGCNSENLPTFRVALISQSSPTNCSSERAAEKAAEKTAEKNKEVIILLWMWPFGVKFDLSCEPYAISGCMLTSDRALYPKAHAVMFHHKDIDSNLTVIPTVPRPSFQKWVWYNMESPANSGKIAGLNDLFNLTCSYRRDSDIVTPYGSLVPLSENDKLFTRVPTKNKVVCWIVSNWNMLYERVEYYKELKKYIEINTYGRAFEQYISDEQYNQIMSSCKFYLSFENSMFSDYITEKLYRPLQLGAVPVVLGPPRENYETHIPGDAFIHIDDFASPKELAERLKHLDKHPDEYMGFFEWRNSFKVVLSTFGQEHACRTCHYLKAQKRYQIFRDLNKWYWG